VDKWDFEPDRPVPRQVNSGLSSAGTRPLENEMYALGLFEGVIDRLSALLSIELTTQPDLRLPLIEGLII